MNDTDFDLCIAVLWDNAIDGRLADERFSSDFDRQEADLRRSFREFLRANGES